MGPEERLELAEATWDDFGLVLGCTDGWTDGWLFYGVYKL